MSVASGDGGSYYDEPAPPGAPLADPHRRRGCTCRHALRVFYSGLCVTWRAGTLGCSFLLKPVPCRATRWGSLKSIVLLPVVVPVHVIACIVVNAIVLCTTLDHAYATLRL